MRPFYKKDAVNKGSSFHHIQLLLPQVFNKICRHYDDRPDLVLASWKEVIGTNFAPFTEAVSLIDGVLTVRVKNSTLYSLLYQHEKHRLLKSLREKFPKQNIKTIQFKLA